MRCVGSTMKAETFFVSKRDQQLELILQKEILLLFYVSDLLELFERLLFSMGIFIIFYGIR